MTDRQTDRLTGKNNMSPDPVGGRHNKVRFVHELLVILNLDCLFRNWTELPFILKKILHWLKADFLKMKCQIKISYKPHLE